MAISPESQEALAIEIARMYGSAEYRLLERMARYLIKGINAPGWQQAKLYEIQNFRQAMQQEVKRLEEMSGSRIEEIITDAYEAGDRSAVADIKAIDRNRIEGTNITITDETNITASFGRVNKHAVKALAQETSTKLQTANQFILRSTEDKYREIVSHNINDALIGAETRKQATQRMLNEFADQGIKSFVSAPDKNGVRRQWDMRSYAEMATRTALGNAAVQGHMDRMQAEGMDLVIVSDHPEECELCRPWERKILSISGEDNNYPSVKEARSNGLWHPHCGHTVNAYIEGLTKVDTPQADPIGNELKEKQRYNERMIRKWKKREAVALDQVERERAKRKRIAWQRENKKFVDAHPNLKRKYERESLTQVR